MGYTAYTLKMDHYKRWTHNFDSTYIHSHEFYIYFLFINRYLQLFLKTCKVSEKKQMEPRIDF